jgi:hypothetical protein
MKGASPPTGVPALLQGIIIQESPEASKNLADCEGCPDWARWLALPMEEHAWRVQIWQESAGIDSEVEAAKTTLGSRTGVKWWP